MPLVSIYTSATIADSAPILKMVTERAATILGKPESIMMVRIEDEQTMSFGGASDTPATLFEIDGIELSDEKAEPLTLECCRLAGELFATSQDRVFVKLTNVPRGMWGGNGKVY